jgi:hypothetical protein
MKSLVDFFTSLLSSENPPLSHLVFLFLVIAIACSAVTALGVWLERKLSLTRWEFLSFPFLAASFGLWMLDVCLLIFTIATLLERLL